MPEDKGQKILMDILSVYDPENNNPEVISTLNNAYGEDYRTMIRDVVSTYEEDVDVDMLNNLYESYGVKPGDDEVASAMQNAFNDQVEKPFEYDIGGVDEDKKPTMSRVDVTSPFNEQVKKGVESWYSDRGALTPYQQLDEFANKSDSLRQVYEERAVDPNILGGVKSKYEPLFEDIMSRTEAAINSGDEESFERLEEEYSRITSEYNDEIKSVAGDVYEQYIQELDSTAIELGLNKTDGGYAIPSNNLETFREVSERVSKQTYEAFKQKEMDSFGRQILNKLGSGSSSVMDTPIYAMSFLEYNANKAYKALGLPTSSYFQDWALGLIYKQRKMSQSGEFSDDSILESVDKGDWESAVKSTILRTTEQIPMLATIFAGSSAGFAKTVSASVGVSEGGRAFREVQDQDIPEYAKYLNATTRFGAEFAGELLGTALIAKQMRKRLMTSAPDLAKRELAGVFQPYYQRLYKNALRFSEPAVTEASSEVATELAGQIVDKYTVDPELKIGDGLGDIAITSAIAGRGMTIRPDIQSYRNKKFVKDIYKSTPEFMDIEDRVNVTDKLIEIQFLEAKISQTNESLSGVYRDRVSKLDSEISDINSKYQSDDTGVSKVEPLKTETDEGIQERQVEQEEVVQEVTDEGQVQEVGYAEGDQGEQMRIESEEAGQIEEVSDTDMPEGDGGVVQDGAKEQEVAEVDEADMPQDLEQIVDDIVLELPEETKVGEEAVEQEAAMQEAQMEDLDMPPTMKQEAAEGAESISQPVMSPKETVKKRRKKVSESMDRFLNAMGKRLEQANLSKTDLRTFRNAKTWKQAAKAMKRVSSKVETAEGVRRVMADFLNNNKQAIKASNIKASDIKGMLNAKTLKQAANAIEKVSDSIDKTIKKAAVREIGKILAPSERVSTSKTSKVQRGKEKLPANVAQQDRMANIRRVMDLSEEAVNKEAADLERRLDKLPNDMAGSQEAIDIAQRLEDLSFAGLDSMTGEEAALMLDNLKAIKKQYREQAKEERQAREEANRQEIEEHVTAIREKKWKKGEVVGEVAAPDARKRKLSVKKIRGALTWGTLDNFASFIDRITKNDPNKGGKAFDGPIYWKWMDKFGKSQMERSRGMQEMNKVITDAQKSFFGVKTDKGLSDRLYRNAIAPKEARCYDGKEWKPLDDVNNPPDDAVVIAHGRNTEGAFDKAQRYFGMKTRVVAEGMSWKKSDGSWSKQIPMNQNIAIGKYNQLKDESLRDTFFKEPETGKDQVERGMGYTQETVDAIEAYLESDSKKYADWMVDELYPMLYERYNEVYRRMNGVNMPFNAVYTPTVREGFDADVSDVTPESFMMEQSFFGTLNNGNMIARRANTLPLAYTDANTDLQTYVDKMELYRSSAEFVRDVQRVFKNKRVREEIEAVHGKVQLEVIDGIMDQMLNKNKHFSTIHKIINGVRKRFTLGSLGLRPNQAIKQQGSYFALIDALGFAGAMKAAKTYVAPKAWKRTFNELMKNPILKERFEQGNFDRDVADVMRNDWQKVNKRKNWPSTFMFFTKWGDIIPFMVGYPSLKSKYLSEAKADGLNDADAKEQAEVRATRELLMWQQSSLAGDLSNVQAGDPFQKLFTMYATSPMSYQRQVAGALRGLGMNIKRGDTKGLKENSRKLLVAHFILPQVFTFMMNGFRFEEEDHIAALFLGNIVNLPFIGEAISYSVDKALGKPFDYAPTPVSGLVNYAEKAFTGIGELLDQSKMGEEIDGDEVWDLAKDVSNFVGYATGVPTGGLYNTVDGVKKTISGESRNPIMEILGWSPYVLEPQAAFMTPTNRAVKYAIEDNKSSMDMVQELAEGEGYEEIFDPLSSSGYTSKATSALKEYHTRTKFGYDNDIANELMRLRSNDDKLLLLIDLYEKDEELFKVQYSLLSQPVYVPETNREYDGPISESLQVKWREWLSKQEEQ